MVAVSTAVIGIYNALKVATGAAAMLNAVLGKNPLLKIAGAVAGLIGAAVVVDQIGDAFDALDAQAKAISANTAVNLAKEKEARSKVTEEVAKLNQEQDKALKALEDTIAKLEQSVAFEREKVTLGETQAQINKMISEESAKLEKVGQSMTSQQRERITLAYQELQAIKDRAAFEKVINDLSNERITVAIADKNEREVTLGIIKMEEQLKKAAATAARKKLIQSHPLYIKGVIKGKSKAQYHAMISKCVDRGMDCDIPYETYMELIAKPCHYCQYQLGSKSKGVALDRLDNSRDYVLGNVASCCKICNTIKNDALTEQEALAAVQAVLNIRNANAVH